MSAATQIDVIAVLDGILSSGTLQDLFLLFCNEGRPDKVVLGLTDTMYKKRALTAGAPESMTKGAFRAMCRSLPGLMEGISVDPDVIFTYNIGYADAKSKKYELKFEHFLDALSGLAAARYPSVDQETAIRNLGMYQLRPFCIQRFGHEVAEEAAATAGDAMSVASSRRRSMSARRASRVVLTSDGTKASPSVIGGPRASIVVASVESFQPSGASVAQGQGGVDSGMVKRRMSVKMGASPLAMVGSPAGGDLSDRRMSMRSPSVSHMPGARSSIASSSSINPFSPEARGSVLSPLAVNGTGPATTNGSAGMMNGSAHASPPASPSVVDEMKNMIRALADVVDDLRKQLLASQNEADSLRARLSKYEHV